MGRERLDINGIAGNKANQGSEGGDGSGEKEGSGGGLVGEDSAEGASQDAEAAREGVDAGDGAADLLPGLPSPRGCGVCWDQRRRFGPSGERQLAVEQLPPTART